MPPETNFDRAFIEIPTRPPCKEVQIDIWEKELEENLGLEREYKTSLQLSTEAITLELQFPSRHHLQRMEFLKTHRDSAIDHMFFMMHLVAYFDGLLKDIKGE